MIWMKMTTKSKCQVSRYKKSYFGCNRQIGPILGDDFSILLFLKTVCSFDYFILPKQDEWVSIYRFILTSNNLFCCQHEQEGTFAQLKLWQSASIAVVFFLSPYISLQTMLFLMLAALVLSLVGFLFLVLKVEKVFSNRAS
ncbi:putative UNC93-like protein 3, plant [Helianthus annuus]|nr:putative UNC93-like protein 3, plant [Helianthus annuus]